VEARVSIEVADCRPMPDQPGRWQVVWLVHNDEPTPVEIHDAWVPHGQFRGDGHVPLAIVVDPGGAARVELAVAAAEAPGAVVRNAFLILRVSGGGRAWRVFARMRVEFDAQAAARPVVEVVTSQSLQ
jgi:hypothetical protein